MDRVHKTIAGTRHTITRRQVLAELARYDRDYPANDYDEHPGGPGWLDSSAYRFAPMVPRTHSVSHDSPQATSWSLPRQV